MATILFFKQKTRHLLYLGLLFSFCISCKNKDAKVITKSENTPEINNNIPVYDFNTLEPHLYTKTDKTYIINF